MTDIRSELVTGGASIARTLITTAARVAAELAAVVVAGAEIRLPEDA